MLCFRKFPIAKKFMDKWGEGVSRFSVENFVYQSNETFPRGTLLCCVSEKFRQQKSLWLRLGGGSKFSVENFLSQMAETFSRAAPLCCVSENFR